MEKGCATDQAATLRKLMRDRAGLAEEARAAPRAARVMTVSSGRSGVGRSSLVANVGALLARAGARVLLVDGDVERAGLDGHFEARHRATIGAVLEGRAGLDEALVALEPNLWLLPASSGVLEAKGDARVSALFEACPWEMDLVLVDSGAGTRESVLRFHGPFHDSVVVVTPEPAAIAEAYGLLKLLRGHSGVRRAEVIVNRVTHEPEARLVFEKLKEVVDRFLGLELEYAGHCGYDENFTRAVMNRKILLDLNPGAPALPALELVSRRFRSRLSLNRIQDGPGQGKPGNTARFWRTLLGEVKA
ncbi:MAG: hypothetical protein NDJ89_04040 [Oligoflexia bacterium]|nr:hypothetical protein [Oligoflexia bacterium]